MQSRSLIIPLFILSYLCASFHVMAKTIEKPLAFKQAKGFGQYSQGGQGGQVYIVNTLQDDPEKPIKGSLRHALKRKYPRTVVFSVSGVIQLKAPIIIKSGYLTIAGQSSPGGITISGAPIKVSNAQHIIMRYMRFRLGTYGFAEDSLSVRDSQDVIIDHCSFSWSVDETASFYNNTRFTLQHSIIAYSLNNSIHPKGPHGYGGIWGGNKATFINNVIANHNRRTPRINGHRLKPHYPQNLEFVELANNVIYNWGANNVYGSENGRFNLINNYYKPGPNSKAEQFVDLWFSPNIKSKQFYINGNHYAGKPNFSKNNQFGIKVRTFKGAKRTTMPQNSPLISHSPLSPADQPDHSIHFDNAKTAYQKLIINKDVGANRNANGVFIDDIDTLVLSQIAGNDNVKNARFIDHEFEQINSWHEYQKQFLGFQKVIDANNDGISDKWANSNKSSAAHIDTYLESLTH
ncbi:MAG: hypothetical protein JKY14_00905 [Paraglaciecola sp.]|nr:hypothetical protein [Paraglaciecola sp.]